MKPWAGAFPLFLLGLAACGQTPATEQAAAAVAQAAEVAETGAPGSVTADHPALRLPAVDGSTYDLAERRGKWVVVNFWATWCGPCIKEMPELDALDKAREDVEVVGLAYEEIEAADMQAFLAQRPVSYPIVIVDPFDPPTDFATPRGLPMTYLIAPDGKVAKPFLGPVTGEDIEAAITEAIAAAQPAA